MSGSLSAILRTWITDWRPVDSEDDGIRPRHFIELLRKLREPTEPPSENASEEEVANFVKTWIVSLCEAGFQLDVPLLLQRDWNKEKAKAALAVLYICCYRMRLVNSPILMSLMSLSEEKQRVVQAALKLLDVPPRDVNDGLFERALACSNDRKPVVSRRLPLMPSLPENRGKKRRSEDSQEFSTSPGSTIPESPPVPAKFVSAQKRRETKLDRVQSELRTARSENEELVRQLESSESQRSRAESHIRSLENTIRSLRADKTNLEDLLRERDSDVDKEQQDSARLDRALAQLRSVKEDLKQEQAKRTEEESAKLELFEKLEKLKAKFEKIAAERESLFRSFEEAQSKVESAEKEQRELSLENNRLQNRLRWLEENANFSRDDSADQPAAKKRRSIVAECSPDASNRCATLAGGMSFFAESEDVGEDMTCVLEARISDQKTEIDDLTAEKVKLTAEKTELASKLDAQVKSNSDKAKFIADLTKDTKTLRAELVQMKEEHKNAIGALEIRLAKANQEKNELIMKLQDAGEVQADLETKLREIEKTMRNKEATASSEINTLKGKMSVLASEMEELERKYNEVCMEVQDQTVQLETAAVDRRRLEDSLSATEARADGLHHEVLTFEKRLKAAQEEREMRVTSMEKEIRGVKEELGTTKTGLDSALKKLKATETELQKTTATLETVVAERVALVAQVGELVATKSSLETAISQSEAELKGKILNISVELKAAQKTVNQTQNGLAQEKIKNEKIERILASKEAELCEVKRYLDSTTKDLEANVVKTRDTEAKLKESVLERNKLTAHVENLIASKAALESSVSQLELTRADLETKARHISSELEGTRKEITKTKAELALEKSKVVDTEKLLNVCKEELRATKSLLNSTSAELVETQLKLKQSEATKTSLDETVHQLQSSVVELEGIVETASANLVKAGMDLKGVQDELAREKENNLTNGKKLKDALEEVGETKLCLASTSEQLRATVVELATTQSTLEASGLQCGELTVKVEELVATKTALETSISQLRSTQVELRDKVHKFSAELEESKTLVSQTKTMLLEEETKNAVNKKLIENITEELTTKSAEVAQLKEELEKANEVRVQLELTVSETAKKLELSERAGESLAKVRERLDEELATTKAQLTTTSSKQQETQDLLDEATQSADRLRDELISLTSEKQNLDLKLNGCQTELSNTIKDLASLREAHATAQRQSELRSAEIESLQQSLKLERGQVADISSELTACEAALHLEKQLRQQENQARTTEIDDLRASVASLQSVLKEREEAFSITSNRLESVEKAWKAGEKELKQLRAEFNSSRSEFEVFSNEHLCRLAEVNSALHEEKQLRAEENQVKTAEFQKLQASVASLRSGLQEKEEALSVTSKQLESAENARKTEEENLKQLRAELESSRSAFEAALNEQLRHLAEANSALHVEKQLREKENEAKTAEIQSLLASVASLGSVLQEKEEALFVTSNRLESAERAWKEEREQLRAELESSRSAFEDASNEQLRNLSEAKESADGIRRELETRLADVNHTLESVRNSLSQSESSVAELREELTNLKAIRDQLVADISGMKDSLDEAKRGSQETERTLRATTVKLENLEKMKAEEETVRRELESKLADSQRNEKLLKSTLSSAQLLAEKRSAELKRNEVELERVSELFAASKTSANSEILQRDEVIAKLQAEIAEQSGVVEVLRKAKEDAELLVQQVQSDLSETKTKFESVEQSLLEARKRSEGLGAELSRVRTLYENALSGLESERAKFDHHMLRSREAEAARVKQLKDFTEELVVVKKAKEAAEQEFCRREEEFLSAKASLESSKLELLSELERNEAKLTALKLDLVQVAKERDETKAAAAQKLKELENDNKMQLARLQSKIAERAKIQEALLGFAEKFQIKLRKERVESPEFPVYFCEKMAAWMTSVQDGLAESDKTTAQLKADKKQLERELAEMASKLERKTSHDCESMKKVERAVAERDAELTRVTGKCRSADQRIHDLEAEVQRQKEQMKTLMADKAHYEAKIAEGLRVKEKYRGQLASLKAAHEAQIKQYATQISSLQAQLNFAEAKLREATDKVGGMGSRLHSKEHIYATIDEHDAYVPPMTRRASNISTASSSSSSSSYNTYASLRSAGPSNSSVKSRISNAGGLTLPCADEQGEVLSATEIAKLQFGKSSAESILAKLVHGSSRPVEDVNGRVSEIVRRNSLYPMHMRSAYATEMAVTANATEQELRNSDLSAMALDVLDRLPNDVAKQRRKGTRRSRSLTPPPPEGRRPLGCIDSNSPFRNPLSPRGMMKAKFGERDQSFDQLDMSVASTGSVVPSHDISFPAGKRSKLSTNHAVPGRAKPASVVGNSVTPRRATGMRLSFAPTGSRKGKSGLNHSAISISGATPSSLKKFLTRGVSSRRSTRGISVVGAHGGNVGGTENVSLLDNGDDYYQSIDTDDTQEDGSPASRTRSKLNSSKVQIFRNPFRGGR